MDTLIKEDYGMSFNMKKTLLIIYLLSSIALGSESNNIKGKEMSIKNSWERLLSYWKSDKNSTQKIEIECKGAIDIEINKLKELYDEIPDEYIKSLEICNPISDKNENYHSWVDSSGWGYLHDINRIISLTDNWKKHKFFSETGVFDYVYGDVSNPKNSALEQWIPIYDWNTDYVVAIDMLSKNKGQVIVFCMEDGTLAKWTNSYEEWFELVVEEVLKYGELRVETIESVLALAISQSKSNHVKE